MIGVPTDTIYGIAGLAQNSSAVKQIYSIKVPGMGRKRYRKTFLKYLSILNSEYIITVIQIIMLKKKVKHDILHKYEACLDKTSQKRHCFYFLHYLFSFTKIITNLI